MKTNQHYFSPRKKLHPYIFNTAAFIASFVFIFNASSQYSTVVDTTSNRTNAVIIAGKEYKKGALHNLFWGSHYRKEWTTPVKIKSIDIDTIFGGLKPILRGGGRQTMTLRMEDKKGKQYVLRSINKTYTKALPEVFQQTFVESIANDQVSIAHPYSALIVPTLANAAKVFHTNPQIVFVPNRKSLGQYREEYGNNLYLLEERPAGFQGESPNFGNTEDVDGTEKMFRKIREENDHRVDQEAFIRARLFDMFLSDWGRHEDQWRWATFRERNNVTYRPIPRDRDQAFTKFDGLLVAFGIKAAQLTYLQSVNYKIKDIKGYNFQARHLDRQLANEPSLQTWTAIAEELQKSLTTQVIERAVKQLPTELYNISGPQLITKLNSRRDNLVDFAKKYYYFLAREVDIVGTENKELFEVTGLTDDDVRVNVYDLDNNGKPKSTPFYSRTFHAGETREVRLYGWNGSDLFKVGGNVSKSIEIRMIGGPKKDSYVIPATAGGKIKLYDNKDNEFNTGSSVKMRLSEDSAVHAFEYAAFKKDFVGFKPGISFSNEDRLFARLGYRIQRQQWRKKPFGYQHDFNINYSITQKAFSYQYKGVYNEAVGKWNLGMLLDYDAIRDMHYVGIGNNTLLVSKDPDYYRFRAKEINGGISLFRNFGLHHSLNFTGFYQLVKVLNDTGRYISKDYGFYNPGTFNQNQFAGITADYDFGTVNDRLFPTRGVRFSTGFEYAQNLKQSQRYVARINGLFGFYLPIATNFTFAFKAGGATLSGLPEFYQLNKLGGGSILRGHRRFRFYGKTAAYNQNELQWNFNVKSYLFSGKLGVLGLLDNGRVWQPGEVSNKWHTGMGGGIMIAPFNRITLTATYSVSREEGRFNVRIGKLL
jgi:hypothetical protein